MEMALTSLAIKNADKLDYILTLVKQSYKQKA